jgi:hypothetical protein
MISQFNKNSSQIQVIIAIPISKKKQGSLAKKDIKSYCPFGVKQNAK